MGYGGYYKKPLAEDIVNGLDTDIVKRREIGNQLYKALDLIRNTETIVSANECWMEGEELELILDIAHYCLDAEALKEANDD